MDLDAIKLIKILGKQKSLIDELLDLANEQLQALKQNDTDKIVSITGHQDYIEKEMSGLEQERKIVLQVFSEKIGVEIKNYRELKPHIGSDEWEDIQNIRNQIVSNCQKLKRENKLNSLLLEQGLKYNQILLGVIKNRSSLIYGKNGNVRRPDSKGLIDTNV